jgi:hypothetical protein
MSVFAQLFIASFIGCTVYVLSAYALDCEEMRCFVNGLKKRLIRKAKPQETIVTSM